jgi:predicted RNA binding protein YcfA (HicA-like mRNA interferase family)
VLIRCLFDRQAAGSHATWFDSETNRYTTIPDHSGTMSEGALRVVLKQAGIDQEEFLKIGK